MQVTDFDRGFLDKAANDMDRTLKAGSPVSGSPDALRLSFKQADAVASGIVALVRPPQAAQPGSCA
jgi:hypothetical protein